VGVTGGEPVGDAPAGSVEHGGLLTDGPLAAEGPVVGTPPGEEKCSPRP
jgi:hypothetical protein